MTSTENAMAQMTSWAGLCAGALSVAAIAASGTPPDANASAGEVQAYLAAHRDTILMAMALYQLAIPFIFVFFAGLAQMIPAGNGVARTLAWAGFAGAVGLQCVAIAGSIPFVAAVWRGASDEIVRQSYDASLVAIYPLTAGLSIASILLPSVAGRMTRTLPLLLLGIALVVVAANVAEIIGFLAFREGPMALGVAPGWVAIPAWTVWVIAASLTLLTRRR